MTCHYSDGVRTAMGLTESLEDYLEVIYQIVLEKKAAHVKDIAAELGVRYPSVTSALQTLSKRGLVNYEPYELVTLTPEGYETATQVAEKHRMLRSFFETVLGLDPKVSDETACRMEHIIPKAAYHRFVQFIKYLYLLQGSESAWLAELRTFFEKEDSESTLSSDLDRYFDGTGFNLPGGKDLPLRAFRLSRSPTSGGSQHPSDGRKP